MELSVRSKNSASGDAASHSAAMEDCDFVGYGHDFSAPGKPNLALAGILLGCPVAVTAFIVLLVAGRPVLEALLIGYGLQALVFLAVVAVGLVGARHPERATPKNNERDHKVLATDDIWRFYPSNSSADAPPRIALIAPDSENSRKSATQLADLGREVHLCSDRETMLEAVQAQPAKWDAVICDLGLAHDIAFGVDDLLDFRATCPDVPVIILSNVDPDSDLMPNGRLIGDVVLQKPILRQHLIAGLDAADLNFALRRESKANPMSGLQAILAPG